jgi:hypothetical protein
MKVIAEKLSKQNLPTPLEKYFFGTSSSLEEVEQPKKIKFFINFPKIRNLLLFTFLSCLLVYFVFSRIYHKRLWYKFCFILNLKYSA